MGSIKKQGLTNTLISYFGVAIGFVNLLVLQPIMLSPGELGLTRILYSATLLIGTLFPVGLNYLTIRFFPRFKDKSSGHHGYLGLLLLLALIGYVVLGIIILLGKDILLAQYGNSQLFIEYFNYIFPISFCVGFTSILTGYCNALFKTSVPTFLNDVYLRGFMTFILALYYLKLVSFDTFVALYASSYVLQLLVLLAYTRFLKAFNLKTDWKFFRSQNIPEIRNYTLLLAVASLASIGIRNLDVMMVGSYLNLDQVAVYSLGMTVGALIEVPITALGRIADAKIADAIQRNDLEMIRGVYEKSVRYLILIGGFLFVLLYASLDEAITFLPQKYHAAKWVIIIISSSALINMATGINNSIIFYSHKYVAGTWLLFGMILLSVILNIILIPLYGIEGSALATALAMILGNLAKFLLIKKHFGLQPYQRTALKIILVILICFLVATFLPPIADRYYAIVINTLLISGLFVGLLVLLKVFSIRELGSFRKTFF